MIAPLIIMLILGIILGAVSVFIILWKMYLGVKEQKRQQDAQVIRMREASVSVKEKEHDLGLRIKEIAKQQEDIESRIISYKECQDENVILKRDLQNIDVKLCKLQMAGDLR